MQGYLHPFLRHQEDRFGLQLSRLDLVESMVRRLQAADYLKEGLFWIRRLRAEKRL